MEPVEQQGIENTKRWWWPGARLALVAIAAWSGGWTCQSFTRSMAPSFGPGSLCIGIGYVSLTLLVAIRLLVPDMRPKLRGRVWRFVGVCLLLLALQAWETASHDGGDRSLSWRAITGVTWHSRSVEHALRDYANWHRDPLPWICGQVIAYLLISRLWAWRAYEVAVGAAAFWIWSAAYFFLAKRPPGFIDFWGGFYET